MEDSLPQGPAERDGCSMREEIQEVDANQQQYHQLTWENGSLSHLLLSPSHRYTPYMGMHRGSPRSSEGSIAIQGGGCYDEQLWGNTVDVRCHARGE